MHDLVLALGAVGIALLSIALDRWYRLRGARTGTRVAAITLALLLGVSLLVIRFANGPVWLGMILGGLWVAAASMPERLVALTGGPHAIVALREAALQIETLALEWSRTPTNHDLEGRIRHRLSELDRVSSPQTNEYIQLFREQIEVLLTGTSWPGGYPKLDRMHDLEREFQRRSERLGVRGRTRQWEAGPTTESAGPST